MLLFEIILALLIAGAFLTATSARIGIPYPVLLALAGVAAAYLPGTGAITLDPQLALALFVAPVLLDAAFDASPRDIKENWLTIGLLAVVVVVLTVVAVAATAHALVPGLSWAAAATLGAIVAPPDAAAATALLRQLRPPHRILVILEGESLLNDASALLIYRFAAAIALAGDGNRATWSDLPPLILAIVGGCALGFVAARIVCSIPRHRADVSIDVLIQFLATFVIWILADQLGASAIITVVTYAMTLARNVGNRMDGRRRIASYAVWEVAVTVLNMLAFIMIGLQIRGILARLEGRLLASLGIAAAVLAAAILVRLAWVMAWNAVMRALAARKPAKGVFRIRPTVGGGVLIAWCGMRGIVTLAAALALPERFPHRDLIVFCAFAVTLGTLLLQGPTLRPLMRRLVLPEDTTVEHEVTLARQRTAQAVLDMIGDDASDPAQLLRQEYHARTELTDDSDHEAAALANLQSRAVAIQRRTLGQLRREGTIGDDAYHTIEHELDIIELTADATIRTISPASS